MTRVMEVARLVLPCVLLAALAPTADGQTTLDGEALRFARAWSAGDLDTLGRMMLSHGIQLRLQGQEHPRTPPRQARASLEEFLARHAPGEVSVSRATLVAGDSSQGFAEILWQTRARGSPESVTFTIFVAFAREDENWRVTEVRVLP